MIDRSASHRITSRIKTVSSEAGIILVSLGNYIIVCAGNNDGDSKQREKLDRPDRVSSFLENCFEKLSRYESSFKFKLIIRYYRSIV